MWRAGNAKVWKWCSELGDARVPMVFLPQKVRGKLADALRNT